jgi:methyl-accepting chemotaxis protein
MHALEGWAIRLLDIMPGKKGMPVQAANEAGYGEAIEASVQLDLEVGRKLDEAVGRTEMSAMAIIEQVRMLCDRSSELALRLRQATQEAESFEQDIAENVAILDQMARFLATLPARLQHDLRCISEIAEEIKGLSVLAEDIHTISMQSHLVSINAAIEASRAGASGLAFKVVASEVRTLAAGSNSAAANINGSLKRIRSVLKEGLEHSAAQSVDDLTRITEAAQAMTQLRASFEHVSSSYHSRLSDMLEHGDHLTSGSAEVLGQLQFQDVVRQSIERLQLALKRRNSALCAEFSGEHPPQPMVLADLIREIAADYMAVELLHGSLAEAPGGAPAIELF